MCSASELADGLEPHAIFTPAYSTMRAADVAPAMVEGVPGVVQAGGYREGNTGYPAEAMIEAYLWIFED